jgi:hypothetical protein
MIREKPTDHPDQNETTIMMTLGEHQLEQIESLLAQSLNGYHFLFDNDTIANILSLPTEEIDLFKIENLERIQELLSGLISCKTCREKQEYLDELDCESYEILLRTYFHIVENSLLSTATLRH